MIFVTKWSKWMTSFARNHDFAVFSFISKSTFACTVTLGNITTYNTSILTNHIVRSSFTSFIFLTIITIVSNITFTAAISIQPLNSTSILTWSMIWSQCASFMNWAIFTRESSSAKAFTMSESTKDYTTIFACQFINTHNISTSYWFFTVFTSVTFNAWATAISSFSSGNSIFARLSVFSSEALIWELVEFEFASSCANRKRFLCIFTSTIETITYHSVLLTASDTRSIRMLKWRSSIRTGFWF